MKYQVLAPGKINLSLFLGPTRDDGRHELVSLFESLTLADVITATTPPHASRDAVTCAGVSGENLALTAIRQLRARGWQGPPVELVIDKRIPVAAGMAGGSADAAATLRLANLILPVAVDDLNAVAAGLGSDVPSQLTPGLVLGTGAGEIVTQMSPLAEHALVVIPSEHELSTPDVYREADRLALGRSTRQLEELADQLRSRLKPGTRPGPELIVNDLQPAAVSLCPSIGAALAAVTDAGADQALVCGSGPTVAGIWWGEDADRRAMHALAQIQLAHPRAVAALPAAPDFGAPVEL